MNRELDDELKNAMLALKIANDAFDSAISGLRQTLDAIQVATHAQSEAIIAIIKAIQLNRE
jgi:hypothetical protein